MVLKELTGLRGAAGNEGAVRQYLIKKLKRLADLVEIDRMGNVVATRRARLPFNGQRVLFCAHMDEVGFIITGIKDDGTLTYAPVGGIDPRVVVSKRVYVGEKAVPGVLGAKAIHLQSPADRASVLGHDSLSIDIGAKDKDAAAEKVEIGDYVYFEHGWQEFGDGLVRTKALDDRVGVYTLLRLMEGEYPCDIVCAFTVQEEVGTRGAAAAAFGRALSCAIVLEGTSANDMGDAPEYTQVCRVGQGAAISFMDNASLSHRGLFNKMRSVAMKENIPWQLKTGVAGGNDAGPLQSANGALPTQVISVPCRYIHSQSCVASFADIDAQFALADAFCRAGGTF